MAGLRPRLSKTKSLRRAAYKDDGSISSSTTFSLSSTRDLMSSYSSAKDLSFSASELGSEQDETDCLSQLASFFEESAHDVPPIVVFRFASFHDFDVERSKAAILASVADGGNGYLDLRMEGTLVQQFERKVLFPLPGVTTKKGNSSVIYMRPSRYRQSVRSEELLIDNLLYVLNDCSRTEQECRSGVCLLVNLKGWSMTNFNRQTWSRFMEALKGEYVPTKVRRVLFVDAPGIFVSMWRTDILPGMCSDLIKGAHFVKQDKVRDFLAAGFEDSMPEGFSGGWRDSDELVEDYVDLKLYTDQQGVGR